jgi:hypothetical protein
MFAIDGTDQNETATHVLTSTGTTLNNVLEQPLSDSKRSNTSTTDRIPPHIHDGNNNPIVVDPNDALTMSAVWWQYAPIIHDRSMINLNAMTRTMAWLVQSSTPMTTMSPIHYYKAPKATSVLINDNDTIEQTTGDNNTSDSSKSKTAEAVVDSILQKQSSTYTSGDPYGYIYYPIYYDGGNYQNRSEAGSGNSIVTIASLTILWKSYFEDIAVNGNDVVCVINNTMGQIFTLAIDSASKVHFLGYDDVHDPNFDHLRVSYNLTLKVKEEQHHHDFYTGIPLSQELVSYVIHVYPSKAMKDSYSTIVPWVVVFGGILCFILTISLFCFYDGIVTKRQKIVMDNAYKTYSIVSSLFPATVMDRMINESTVRNDNTKALGYSTESIHSKKKTFDASTAIADFYPSATVLCTYFLLLYPQE